jgi:hypothetical protein
VPGAVVAVLAAWLPQRFWGALPIWIPVERAAFASGILTIFAGAAIGIPGFLEHAGANVSFLNQTLVTEGRRNADVDYNRGMVQGFAGLSIFTFLFFTPTGLVTLYLLGSGAARAGGAWFDDPIGDPMLTGIDYAVAGGRDRHRRDARRRRREALEGPEVPDRVVTPAAAGLPGCDVVIVASRLKPGWENGVTVFTANAAYRIGQPVERTVAGRLRTLYPLSEHTDFEAVRKSVIYDLPRPASDVRGPTSDARSPTPEVRGPDVRRPTSG